MRHHRNGSAQQDTRGRKTIIEGCFAELESQKQHPQPLNVAWGAKFKSEQKLDVFRGCVTEFERELICGSDSKMERHCAFGFYGLVCTI